MTALGAQTDTGVPSGQKVYLVKNGNTIEVWDAPTGGTKIKTIPNPETDGGFTDLFEKIQMTCRNNDGIAVGVSNNPFQPDSCPAGYAIKEALSAIGCAGPDSCTTQECCNDLLCSVNDGI